MNEKEITIALARIPLLHNLNSRQLQNLSRLAVPRDYAAGISIVSQGETGIGLFIIIEGQAAAIRTLADGGRVMVNTFGPGDFFGEMALLDEGARTASVVATTPVRCLVLARWDFMALLKTDNEMAVEILTEMAHRFRTMLAANELKNG
jgi:CRP/FNR family transcriptional regulator, cyclic AMP receptor protein